MATLLTHLAVLGLALGVAVSSAWGWREELTLAPGETVDVGMGSGWRRKPAAVAEAGKGLQVRNVGFTVMRYADGGVAGCHAEVDLSEGGSETIRGHIRLNQLLTYHGIAFTLQRYTALDQGYLVTLSAGRDPGYAVVIAAGLLMFLGLTVSFNCPQCCIYVRIEGEGRLRLAGRADRRAWSFDRGFTALVEEIDRVGRTLGGHDNRCSR
jgi:cytochrome c biogenesis protein ResB